MNTTQTKTASLVFLFLAVLLVFSPALKNGFTNWDDDGLLTGNQLVRDISWQNTKRIFTTFTVSTYIPLTVFSYSLEYRFWGLNPSGYHTVNLALHACNACLVLLLLYLLGAGWWPAFAAALLWAVHPMRVESVAWITERKDVLYAFFFLSSLICHMLYLKQARRGYYLLSLVLFAVSGLSKGMAVMLPLALLLTDHLSAGRPAKRTWLEKMPFFALAAGFLLAGFWAQRSGGYNPEYTGYVWWQRVLIAGHNLVFYLSKIIWPVKLSALYPYPGNGSGALPWTFWAALLPAAAFIWAAIAISRRFPKAGWGAWFFLIMIAPVLQMARLLGPAMAADRYTYLASAGLAFILAWGLGKADDFFAVRKRSWRMAAAAILFSLAVLLSGLTWQRCRIWSSSLTLWNDVIARYPQAAVAYNNRGKYFLDLGLPDSALDDFNSALCLRPDYVTVLGNRALVYLRAGEYNHAIADLDRAISLDPRDTRNMNNRGALFVKQGDLGQAMACFNTALEINPGYADAYYNRSLLHYVLKDYGRSLSDLNQVLAIDPYHAKAYLKRARLQLDLGQPGQAIGDAEKVLSLEAKSAVAYNILGRSYMAEGKPEKALEQLNRALKIDPELGETYYNLALIYNSLEDYSRSRECLQKSREMGYQPDIDVIKNSKEKIQ